MDLRFPGLRNALEAPGSGKKAVSDTGRELSSPHGGRWICRAKSGPRARGALKNTVEPIREIVYDQNQDPCGAYGGSVPAGSCAPPAPEGSCERGGSYGIFSTCSGRFGTAGRISKNHWHPPRQRPAACRENPKLHQNHIEVIVMLLKPSDVIQPVLTDGELQECLSTAQVLLKNMRDRADLHARGTLERYIDIAMGEIAERSVIKWIQSQGKFAESAVDKTSGRPDDGHDIILHGRDGRSIKCSVKSSLSVHYSKVEDFLQRFHLSSKKSEIRGINIQVYYWLDLSSTPRVVTPSERNMAIIGWLGRKDLTGIGEGQYATESRPVVEVELSNMRPMRTLLDILQ